MNQTNVPKTKLVNSRIPVKLSKIPAKIKQSNKLPVSTSTVQAAKENYTNTTKVKELSLHPSKQKIYSKTQPTIAKQSKSTTNKSAKRVLFATQDKNERLHSSNSIVPANKGKSVNAKTKFPVKSNTVLKQCNADNIQKNTKTAVIAPSVCSKKPISTFEAKSKRSPVKYGNHFSQAPVEFVVDESSRNRILAGKELSPTILKLPSRFKISARERPSTYQDISKALDNILSPAVGRVEFEVDERSRARILSGKEISPAILKSCSKFKLSTINDRPSLYNKYVPAPNAYLAAIKSLESIKPSERGTSLILKKEPCSRFWSPIKDRNSLFANVRINPKEEALKSLEALRLAEKSKSCKKVTFNLPSSKKKGSPVKVEVNEKEFELEVYESRLTDISEKSDASSVRSTPEFEGFYPLPSDKQFSSLNFDSNMDTLGKTPTVPFFDTNPTKVSDMTLTEDIEKLLPVTLRSHLIDPQTDKSVPPNVQSSTVISLTETDATSTSPRASVAHVIGETKNHRNKDCVTSSHTTAHNISRFQDLTKSIHASGFRSSIYGTETKTKLFGQKNEMSSKLCTPQPISFYPKSRLTNSISPEFLCRRTSNYILHAPIKTPLVLKNMASKSQEDLSPVCKKLNFAPIHKDTEDTKEMSQTVFLRNILSQQNILDHLADQECNVILSSATYPHIVSRYLLNPIAYCLNDGDEMHFVPVDKI